jgi:hypothetical protein
MSRSLAFLVAGALAALVPLAAAQDHPREPDRKSLIPEPGTIDLRPKWEKGQQVRYTLELKNASLNDAKPAAPRARPGTRQPPKAGQPSLRDNESRSTVQMGLVFKVKEVSPEKEATVDVTIDRLKLSTLTPDGEVEFDSSKPAKGAEDDLIGQAFKSIVGTTMTMTVDRDGTIKQVTGGEGLALLGGVGGGAGGAPGTAQLFGPIFSGRPAKGQARIGESWDYDDALTTGLLGDFKMKVRHTLTGLRGSDAVVTIRGQIDPKTEAPGSSAFQVKDSNYNGQYLWDTTKGQLKSMETSMSVRLDGKTGDNQELATRNEATVKITRDQASH